MSLPVFPPLLPLPSLPGYGFKPQSTFRRSSISTGRAANKRERNNAPERITLTWDFNVRELMLFEVWYRYGIHDGKTPFVMKLKTAQGIVDRVVSVVDIYSKDCRSQHDWVVRMDCQTQERITS